VKIDVSFIVQLGTVPNHHVDRRFKKTFEVDWPGRPATGETVELDVGPPLRDYDFEVAGVYWAVADPPLIHLRDVVIPPREVEWQDGIDGYIDYCRKKGWEVHP
jgi:hypothetical protein